MRRLARAGGHGYGHHMNELAGSEPGATLNWPQVRQPCLLGRFPQSDGQRIPLARIAVTPYLHEVPELLVPPKQHAARRGVNNKSGRRQVQCFGPAPRISHRLYEANNAQHIGLFHIACRLIDAKSR